MRTRLLRFECVFKPINISFTQSTHTWRSVVSESLLAREHCSVMIYSVSVATQETHEVTANPANPHKVAANPHKVTANPSHNLHCISHFMGAAISHHMLYHRDSHNLIPLTCRCAHVFHSMTLALSGICWYLHCADDVRGSDAGSSRCRGARARAERQGVDCQLETAAG